MVTQQKKKSNGRYEDTNYRYSTKFINQVSAWLTAWIFIGLGIGAGLSALGYVIFGGGLKIPDWYNIIAISFAASAIVIPLIVGAWLGGAAINKYGGLVGLLLVFGIGVFTTGYILSSTLWYWIGIGAMALSTILFFYIGFQAKVPIWLQLPILNSPRLYLSKGEQPKKKPRKVKDTSK
jgi:hypothetical protein